MPAKLSTGTPSRRASGLHGLFISELRDMYDGEKRLIRALPKMAKAAESSELQTAFTTHLRQTKQQVTRLEQVFRSIGEKPRGRACDGIMGIIEEGNKAIQELDEGPVLDAALIAGAQKAEHYEIASYGTLAYFADLMGHGRAKELLGDTLDEEKAADNKLSQIAKSKVNRRALRDHGSMEERGMMGLQTPRPVRRAAAAVGLAHERSSRRGSSSRTSSNRGRTSRKRSR